MADENPSRQRTVMEDIDAVLKKYGDENWVKLMGVCLQDISVSLGMLVDGGLYDKEETVSGSTPSITGVAGTRYKCGEVTTLDITVPESGCIDVVFESGSTPTVLTVTPTKTGVAAVRWPDWFDPDNLDADSTYELNILDGEYGAVGVWS